MVISIRLELILTSVLPNFDNSSARTCEVSTGNSYSLSLKCILVIISWSCSLVRRSGCNCFSRTASTIFIICFKSSAK